MKRLILQFQQMPTGNVDLHIYAETTGSTTKLEGEYVNAMKGLIMEKLSGVTKGLGGSGAIVMNPKPQNS